MHYAFFNKNFKIANFLIKHGANESIYNNVGLSPWQCLNSNLELYEENKNFLREYKRYKSMKSLKSNRSIKSKSYKSYRSYRSFKTYKSSRSKIEFQLENNENL